MDNNKKSVFQIDQDLLQEFFNKDSGTYNGGGGGNSFYESDHDKDNILRYSGFGGGSNFYGNFDNYINPINNNQNPLGIGGASFLDDPLRLQGNENSQHQPNLSQSTPQNRFGMQTAQDYMNYTSSVVGNQVYGSAKVQQEVINRVGSGGITGSNDMQIVGGNAAMIQGSATMNYENRNTGAFAMLASQTVNTEQQQHQQMITNSTTQAAFIKIEQSHPPQLQQQDSLGASPQSILISSKSNPGAKQSNQQVSLKLDPQEDVVMSSHNAKGSRRKDKEKTKNVTFEETKKQRAKNEKTSKHEVSLSQSTSGATSANKRQQQQQQAMIQQQQMLPQMTNQNYNHSDNSMDGDDDDMDDYGSEDSDSSAYRSKMEDPNNKDPKKKQRRTRGGASTDSRQRRLEKNRESARESRKRKKNYINTLEAKVKTLESEVNRLRLVIQNQREKEKLSYFSHLDSMDQLLKGRQVLYERLENCITQNADGTEIENIINALQIRTGSFGIERKNLVNNLFKSIIEVSFPNFVKYLFWGCSENKGLFDENGILDAERRRKLSKYQLEELKSRAAFDEWESINELMNLRPEQQMKIKQEQLKINEQKDKFKGIIDTLLEQKRTLFKELNKMDHCMGRLRSYLTTEQTAKFLILMEKYKSKDELNIFRLWNIKKLDRQREMKKIHYMVQGIKDSDEDVGLPESDDDILGLSRKNMISIQGNNENLHSSSQVGLGGGFNHASHDSSQANNALQSMIKKQDYLLN
eukprot:403356280